MIDSSSPEFKLGEKIGYHLGTYLKVHLILKSAQFVLKHSCRIILFK